MRLVVRQAKARMRILADKADVRPLETLLAQFQIDLGKFADPAAHTDFTAKLIDVYPPNEVYPQGFDMNISDGIIRARYRDSFEKAELMEPGQVYKFDIELYPTSNLFKRGHRIRVDVSSSNFPRLDVNPNTGEPLGLNQLTQTAINTVYHDSEHPSQILLPVVSN